MKCEQIISKTFAGKKSNVNVTAEKTRMWTHHECMGQADWSSIPKQLLSRLLICECTTVVWMLWIQTSEPLQTNASNWKEFKWKYVLSIGSIPGKSRWNHFFCTYNVKVKWTKCEWKGMKMSNSISPGSPKMFEMFFCHIFYLNQSRM